MMDYGLRTKDAGEIYGWNKARMLRSIRSSSGRNRTAHLKCTDSVHQPPPAQFKHSSLIACSVAAFGSGALLYSLSTCSNLVSKRCKSETSIYCNWDFSELRGFKAHFLSRHVSKTGRNSLMYHLQIQYWAKAKPISKEMQSNLTSIYLSSPLSRLCGFFWFCRI